MRLEYSTAGKIIFGEGTVIEAATAARHYGERVLFVSGSGSSGPGRMEDYLSGLGMRISHMVIRGEPDVETILRGLDSTRSDQVDVVVAFGGGSVIDAAKVIAVLSKNSGSPLDYLEVVGKGQSITQSGIPLIAVPTTAGAGSEVTRNAVLIVPEKGMKVSLRSPFLLPALAVIDPELSASMPASLTACTGMDALAQVIEPYVSLRANPITDLYCKEGMARVGRSLLRAYKNSHYAQARTDMSYASLMGGLALANAGLGAVHGFASPIGGMFNAAHGAICARLLAPVIQVNLRALHRKVPDSLILHRYREVAQIVTGSHRADTAVLVDWLEALSDELQVPRLAAMGIERKDFAEIADRAAAASSMKANPVVLSLEELNEVLELGL